MTSNIYDLKSQILEFRWYSKSKISNLKSKIFFSSTVLGLYRAIIFPLSAVVFAPLKNGAKSYLLPSGLLD